MKICLLLLMSIIINSLLLCSMRLAYGRTFSMRITRTTTYLVLKTVRVFEVVTVQILLVLMLIILYGLMKLLMPLRIGT